MINKNRTAHTLRDLIALCILISPTAYDAEGQTVPFDIGVIADCQYCDAPTAGARHYSNSDKKLTACVDHFNTLDLEFVIHLGDFIDRDFESFDVVQPIYDALQAPGYHVLGNHDFSVTDAQKKDVPKKLGLTSRYYDFTSNGWRWIVLDGNDISFHAYPEDSANFSTATEYYEKNAIQSPKWNGAVGPKQLSWIESVLQTAESNKEIVMLFCHFPVYPENVHNLWNAAEIVSLLERYSCVKAYVNGHNHSGGYGEKNGIHYITMKGMVNTEQTAYATFQLDNQRIQITGFGREKDQTLQLRKPND